MRSLLLVIKLAIVGKTRARESLARAGFDEVGEHNWFRISVAEAENTTGLSFQILNKILQVKLCT